MGGLPIAIGAKAKSHISFALRLAFLGCAAFLLGRSLDMPALRYQLRIVSAAYLLCAVGIQLFMRWIMAWQLNCVLEGYGISAGLKNLFAINLAVTFYGLVLPGELVAGGVGWHRLYKAGIEAPIALAAIVATRFVNLVVLFLIGLLFWIAGERVGSYPTGISLLLMLLGAVGAYWAVSTHGHRLARLPLPARLQPMRQSLMKTLAALRGLPPGSLAALYELTLGLNLVGIAGHFLFAKAVGLSLPIWTIGWIRSAVLALGLLPLSIGGIGVREASLVYLLKLHGASMEQAVTYSALVLLSTLGVALLGAASELAYVLRRRRSKGQTPSSHPRGDRNQGS